MNKTIFTVLLTLFVTTSIFAQRPDREKIKTLKIAHITEQLDLSKSEAEKFWPIYNANEEAKDKLRTESSNRRKEKMFEEYKKRHSKNKSNRK
ncbi:hypothetical protein [uncultured Winogradskyella sp.]|uniref:hypothetical protein n=1 Tax=uncultured Winogradskyella sp. TaxID=395353 RepID=UPI0030EBF052